MKKRVWIGLILLALSVTAGYFLLRLDQYFNLPVRDLYNDSNTLEHLFKKMLKIEPLNHNRFDLKYTFVIRVTGHTPFDGEYVTEYFSYDDRVVVKSREAKEGIFMRMRDFHEMKKGRYRDEEMIDHLLKTEITEQEYVVVSKQIHEELSRLEGLLREYTPPRENKSFCIDVEFRVIEVFNPRENYYLQYQFICPPEDKRIGRLLESIYKKVDTQKDEEAR